MHRLRRLRSRLPRLGDFCAGRFPEKWKQYTELNEGYVKAGKFTPEEYGKHQVK
jgi:hypothetical protein